MDCASEAQIIEWDQGEMITYMPPRREHQEIVHFLSHLLTSYIQFFNLGTVIITPFEVKLWPNSPAREPDIIFIVNSNLSKLSSERFTVSPDLVVEVISPSSITEDRVHKFEQYAQAGVQEYWIIDPRPHQQQADFYRLSSQGQYYAATLDDKQGSVRYYPMILADFWLDIAWFSQAPLPNSQLALSRNYDFFRHPTA